MILYVYCCVSSLFFPAFTESKLLIQCIFNSNNLHNLPTFKFTKSNDFIQMIILRLLLFNDFVAQVNNNINIMLFINISLYISVTE